MATPKDPETLRRLARLLTEGIPASEPLHPKVSEVVVMVTDSELARAAEDQLTQEKRQRPEDPTWKSMNATNRRRQEILSRIQRQRDQLERERRKVLASRNPATTAELQKRADQEAAADRARATGIVDAVKRLHGWEDNAFMFGTTVGGQTVAVDRAKGPDQTVAVQVVRAPDGRGVRVSHVSVPLRPETKPPEEPLVPKKAKRALKLKDPEE